MERKLTRTYNEARTELTKEWQAFMKKQEPKVKDAYEDLQKALQTGNTQTIFDARVYYQRVMMNTTIRNNRYRGMVNNLTSKIADVNKTALNYVNGNMANIYTINYNAFSDEDIKGYSFTLVNENAIRELMTTDKILVPTKKLNVSKDRAWNTKFINSQVTQGIMQGESIDKIAKRILPEIVSKSGSDLIKRNRNSAIRNARTMTTVAENKGRQDSFKKAQSDGVIMTRTWVATHDERTRAWHSDMDGVETTIDEPWENDYGEIMFPGDPAAHPANVYNCRCSIRAHVKGFDWSKEDTTEEKSINGTQVGHEIINGKDISDTWHRRPDKFDFEIEDVINAQGFDGLPRVVSPEEFDRYVEESNFIAQRTYSAPDRETLDLYRDQLYHGKWYVDCSTGGAQYGQGMYCAADYNGKITQGMLNEMVHYQELGSERGQNIFYTETMTLDKSAKIIEFGDLREEKTLFAEQSYNQKVNDAISELSEVEKALYRYTNATETKEDRALIREFRNTNSDAYRQILDDNRDKWKDIERSANNEFKKINEMNDGTFAAMRGYDAINAEGHGESGSYTVILNRTKVIFKGE